MTVSRPVMRSSWNQRRAIPVVTMTTFQLGVSGVASRSRFTTPTLSGSPRIDSAMGRMPRVFPVPVPATMPKPLAEAARVADLLPVLPLQQGLEVEAERKLDGLARGARGRDDDDAAAGMRRVAVGVGVGGEVVIAGGAHGQEGKGGRTGLSP